MQRGNARGIDKPNDNKVNVKANKNKDLRCSRTRRARQGKGKAKVVMKRDQQEDIKFVMELLDLCTKMGRGSTRKRNTADHQSEDTV